MARAQADDAFTELQVSASLQAPPSELTTITADLRSTLSDSGVGENGFGDLLELFVDLIKELSKGTTGGSN